MPTDTPQPQAVDYSGRPLTEGDTVAFIGTDPVCLHSYHGPAQINGIDFTDVHVSEHADSEGIVIHMGWEGAATVSRKSAPAINPGWVTALLESMQPVEVRLPEIGTGRAYLTDATLTHDGVLEYWQIEFTGSGPSPWAEGA
jgi:hypothetical protein